MLTTVNVILGIMALVVVYWAVRLFAGRPRL
jgi:hypothetical protein